jgi:Protein of unknown function (DUF2490)
VKPLKYCLIILWVLAALQSKSQNTFTQQWQAWFRYYNQTQLSEKFTLHTEIDERINLNPAQQFQFFTHVHLHYRIKPWLDVAAGFNFNTTNPPFNPTLRIPELRPWQEAIIIKNLGKDIQFQFRYRLDERFIHNNDRQVLVDGYHFNWRHRFRIQFSKPIVEFNNNRTLTLKFSDEVMLNTGDVPRLFDQNRIFASLEIKLNERFSFESGYLNLIQPVTDDVYYERHIIRSTLRHTINAKNKG